MHPLRSIRRVALGAAVAGAAIGAVPAMASAASTCNYLGSTDLNIVDGSGPEPLRIVRSNERITIVDGPTGTPIFCAGADVAEVGNTNRINISGPIMSTSDGYVVDESAGRFAPGFTTETTGRSEIEILANTTGGVRGMLEVRGTSERDVYRVGANGLVDLGGDGDADFSITAGATEVRLLGAGGPDILSGQSIADGVASVKLLLDGGSEADSLKGGTATDDFRGGEGNDTLLTVDKKFDFMSGGPQFDRALVDRAIDVFTDGIEDVIELPQIGRLRLAPAVLKAEAGRTARLEISWKHPKAWRELLKVQMKVYRDEKAVAVIDARPGRGSLSSTGAIDLVRGSKLGHHGKWVTAKLAMRLPRSLAGDVLRVDVLATDRRGQRQVERDAGTIRVAE
jgi:Ca2+-binding RTX toxin-like protein